MLRSTIFVYCALMALFFLKKRLYRHHWTSMGVIIVGVVMVGFAFILYKEESDEHTTTDIIIGLVLL